MGIIKKGNTGPISNKKNFRPGAPDPQYSEPINEVSDPLSPSSDGDSSDNQSQDD